MTRFQKVASALRGGAPEPDEQDQTAADQVAAADQSGRAQMGMANSPVSREANPQGDYWDEPVASAAADRDEAVVVTSPDAPVTGTGTSPLARQDQRARAGRRGHGGSPGDSAGHVRRHHARGQRDHVIGSGRRDHPRRPGRRCPANGIPASGSGRRRAGEWRAGRPSRRSRPSRLTRRRGRQDGTPLRLGGTESRPGGAAGALGDFSDLTFGNLIPDAAHYTEQWQQTQFRFVDDPHGSVTEAAEIVAQVTAKMEAAIQERQRAIEERQRAIAEQQRSLRGRWGDDANADTEALRETLRMYKTFLDQLIGPRAG